MSSHLAYSSLDSNFVVQMEDALFRAAEFHIGVLRKRAYYFLVLFVIFSLLPFQRFPSNAY